MELYVKVIITNNYKEEDVINMAPIPIMAYKDLNEFAKHCGEKLLEESGNIEKFVYPDEVRHDNDESTWQEYIDVMKQKNDDLLSNLGRNANIYAIHKWSAADKKWIPMYVGERKTGGMRERITQHLIDKNVQTGSKLTEVKKMVRSGESIGVSFVKVEPESLRLYVEEQIISNFEGYLWNIQGAVKGYNNQAPLNTSGGPSPATSGN
ncbi:hypothetical protein GCM10028778_12530 [Barrientosiimonas marina]|uniref:GIY-YIG nuclease family protein n=1 Tax=Lentibacillus kimchii TaxID=1542911 RepID=A0ABW2UTC8_9BACI